MAEYRRLAYKAGTVAIVQADTEDLKKYLTGVVDDCSQIDHSMPAKKPSAPAPRYSRVHAYALYVKHT